MINRNKMTSRQERCELPALTSRHPANCLDSHSFPSGWSAVSPIAARQFICEAASEVACGLYVGFSSTCLEELADTLCGWPQDKATCVYIYIDHTVINYWYTSTLRFTYCSVWPRILIRLLGVRAASSTSRGSAVGFSFPSSC